jgi:hypothetical protein
VREREKKNKKKKKNYLARSQGIDHKKECVRETERRRVREGDDEREGERHILIQIYDR